MGVEVGLGVAASCGNWTAGCRPLAWSSAHYGSGSTPARPPTYLSTSKQGACVSLSRQQPAFVNRVTIAAPLPRVYGTICPVRHQGRHEEARLQKELASLQVCRVGRGREGGRGHSRLCNGRPKPASALRLGWRGGRMGRKEGRNEETRRSGTTDATSPLVALHGRSARDPGVSNQLGVGLRWDAVRPGCPRSALLGSLLGRGPAGGWVVSDALLSPLPGSDILSGVLTRPPRSSRYGRPGVVVPPAGL
jgi:hypothetical protein